MAPKRNDRVAPPGRPGAWEARFATSEAAKGWEELCRTARSNTWEAWVVLTERPITPENPSRQQKLRGQLGCRNVFGRTLEQWQYEVTSGGRIWYCPGLSQPGLPIQKLPSRSGEPCVSGVTRRNTRSDWSGHACTANSAIAVRVLGITQYC
jgi:hypothetical protein